MLFFKKNINLILFIVLLVLSVFVLIFSEELSKIESLENKDKDKDEDKKDGDKTEDENSKNCNKPSKILQSTSNSSQVKTDNIVQNSTYKSKLQSCLFSSSPDEQIEQLKKKEKKNNTIN